MFCDLSDPSRVLCGPGPNFFHAYIALSRIFRYISRTPQAFYFLKDIWQEITL
jgi:hypothetical protein